MLKTVEKCPEDFSFAYLYHNKVRRLCLICALRPKLITLAYATTRTSPLLPTKAL